MKQKHSPGVKTEEEIKLLRESGRRLARVLAEVSRHAVVGVSAKELDTLAEKLIRDGGDTPAFKNYQPEGADYPYPATLCISINEEVVHGIPGERVLLEGDIVSLDLGLTHQGLITDMAVTVPVGKIDRKSTNLIAATRDALAAGIAAARGGNTIGDIGAAIEELVKSRGFKVVDILGGHAVGNHVHEEPFVPNYGEPGDGPKLKPGMVLALEPIVSMGSGEVFIDRDGYTYKTEEGVRAAHFEDTILITESAAEILTRP